VNVRIITGHNSLPGKPFKVEITVGTKFTAFEVRSIAEADTMADQVASSAERVGHQVERLDRIARPVPAP
jgi:hypothetical protein